MLALMGSGETSPTMVEVHKSLLRGRRPMVILDTPYGFQSNADELSAKAVRYFADSVGADTQVVSLRSSDVPARQLGVAVEALRQADAVFAGPGSPTYAAQQWRAVGMAELLVEILRRDGIVTLASAASISAGALALPVYEIYKAGLPAVWQPGLDVLGHFGLTACVIPHFNNTEGGTHDTSCCYVGRARLDELRRSTPEVPVLGIDEHTALLIDLETGRATVHGLSSAHVLRGDEQIDVPTGESFDLRAALGAGTAPATAAAPTEMVVGASLQQAVDARDAAAVVTALAELVPRNEAAAAAALEQPLGRGWQDTTGPFCSLLLEVRQLARDTKLWAVSDLVRDGLTGLGIVVEDTPQGQQLRPAHA